ncbi:hypothetical protein JXA88_15230 [Candidatus Fermentibacteria bacterium]|nr:hypothetical protein [Candidatus Fermentibacteria bacterium]
MFRAWIGASTLQAWADQHSLWLALGTKLFHARAGRVGSWETKPRNEVYVIAADLGRKFPFRHEANRLDGRRTHRTLEVSKVRLTLWIVTALVTAGVAQSLAQDELLAPEQHELPRVAVLDFRNRTEIDSLDAFQRIIRQAIASRLISTGRILIVSQEEVSAVLDTLAPELGYLTNERQAFRLGESVNAEKVVFGSFTRTGDIVNIKTYIVNCVAKTVHTIEQIETNFDITSDQAGMETARVVQGQIAGITPVGSAPQRAPTVARTGKGSSPLLHVRPWAAIGATIALGYLTYHYDSRASDTWDEYLRAIGQYEITRLYNKSSDYLLARNAVAVLAAGGLALTIHYWFNHDFGSSEQWSAGPSSAKTWSPVLAVCPRGVGMMVSRRF